MEVPVACVADQPRFLAPAFSIPLPSHGDDGAGRHGDDGDNRAAATMRC